MAELNISDYLARVEVINEATYQIDKLVEALQRAAITPEVIEIEWLVRGIAPRLQQLNGAIMRCTSSEESVESIREVLTH